MLKRSEFSADDLLYIHYFGRAHAHLELPVCWIIERGEFHIPHDASRLISVFSLRWKERSRVSREIFNDLNFKMQLIQGKFQ